MCVPEKKGNWKYKVISPVKCKDLYIVSIMYFNCLIVVSSKCWLNFFS